MHGKALSSRAVSMLEARYCSAAFMPVGVTLESATGDVRDLIATVRELQINAATLQSRGDAHQERVRSLTERIHQLEQQLRDMNDAADDMCRGAIEAGTSGQPF